VIFYWGDEAVRTRLRTKLTSSHPPDHNPLVQLFLRDFPDQQLAEDGLDLSQVSYKKEDRLFESCLRQIKVILIGSAGHHSNSHTSPMRPPLNSSLSPLSSATMVTQSPSYRQHSWDMKDNDSGRAIPQDDSMAVGWSVQPKRIVLPPRPDKLGMCYCTVCFCG